MEGNKSFKKNTSAALQFRSTNKEGHFFLDFLSEAFDSGSGLKMLKPEVQELYPPEKLTYILTWGSLGKIIDSKVPLPRSLKLSPPLGSISMALDFAPVIPVKHAALQAAATSPCGRKECKEFSWAKTAKTTRQKRVGEQEKHRLKKQTNEKYHAKIQQFAPEWTKKACNSHTQIQQAH